MQGPDFATPADLALCRQMIRQGSKSFHLASLLLPTFFREHARALYGFCRMADDLVDGAADTREAVARLAQRLDSIYLGRPGDDPTDRAFADVVRRFAIPRAVPDALIEGFAWDATGRRYETFSDVVSYGVRVAGTVGVMMALIMGQRHPLALARALDLGVAMQLSNIARDVEEDAAADRVYVPDEFLKRHGANAESVLRDSSTAAAAASLLVREAEALYARARGGIAMLPLSCRASIEAARLLYREIGLAAERQSHRGRAVVPGGRKLQLVAKALANIPFSTAGVTEVCLEEGRFLVDAVAREPEPPAQPRGVDGQLGWVMQMLISVEGRRP